MNNSNWWANRLGAPTPTSSTPPVTPSYQQPPQAFPAAPAAPAAPARASEACPNCRSGNYGKLTAETRARCYDCGYPIVQQGSGMPGLSQGSSGPSMPSRQAAGGGWNPTSIVDRIG